MNGEDPEDYYQGFLPLEDYVDTTGHITAESVARLVYDACPQMHEALALNGTSIALRSVNNAAYPPAPRDRLDRVIEEVHPTLTRTAPPTR